MCCLYGLLVTHIHLHVISKHLPWHCAVLLVVVYFFLPYFVVYSPDLWQSVIQTDRQLSRHVQRDVTDGGMDRNADRQIWTKSLTDTKTDRDTVGLSER